MHNAVFRAIGLNWDYVPLAVPPNQVEAAVRGLAALGFRGANVTVPHKQTAVSLVDALSADARALGAVNTLTFQHMDTERRRIVGDNTDAQGFLHALSTAGFRPNRHDTAVVIGAGGAARAVVFGLLALGLKHIAVSNRTEVHARRLVTDLARHSERATHLEPLPLVREALVESARAASLLVNATSVGMWPDTDASIWPEDVPVPSHLTVFDLVYNPLETRLLRQSRLCGARTIDGLGMLVHQGAIAFGLWTGFSRTAEVASMMRDACLSAVARQT
jgi:shikimate dehydrogenase